MLFKTQAEANTAADNMARANEEAVFAVEEQCGGWTVETYSQPPRGIDDESVWMFLMRHAPDVWDAICEWCRDSRLPSLATDEELDQLRRALLLRMNATVEQALEGTP